MAMFWTLCGLLLLAGLLFLLRPLWRTPGPDAVGAAGANAAVYRDQLREAERDLAADLISPERFEQLRAEIQRRVLEDAGGPPAAVGRVAQSRGLAVMLAVLIPVASLAVYLALGRPDAADPQALHAAGARAGDHQVTGEQIEQMVGALAQRLEAQPDDSQGWVMLGRSYVALNRFDEASAALRKALALQPRNPDVLADLADVQAVAQGGRFAGEPARLIQQALEIDPQHVKALALAGSVAFDNRDYTQAKALWQRLLAAVPAESDIARSVRGSIEEATRLQAPAAAAPAAAASAAVRLTGEVSLSPALADKVRPGDTVFVFARAAQGSRMPLAIVRQPAGAWPLKFTFDDSTAMTPEQRLSAHPQVVVVVRVSRSGNATAQSGDLEGSTGPVPHGSQGVRLTVDRIRP